MKNSKYHKGCTWWCGIAICCLCVVAQANDTKNTDQYLNLAEITPSLAVAIRSNSLTSASGTMELSQNTSTAQFSLFSPHPLGFDLAQQQARYSASLMVHVTLGNTLHYESDEIVCMRRFTKSNRITEGLHRTIKLI